MKTLPYKQVMQSKHLQNTVLPRLTVTVETG